jgi:hypothetical protein
MFHRIGIALAAYQPHENYFFRQLESIQGQSHTDWVCCVQFDSPIEAIKKSPQFGRFFGDPRFKWTENPKSLGHLKNFEGAIQAVLAQKADAVACCDQDDVWYPKKLEILLAELNRIGSLGLAFCDMNLIDQSGKVSEKTAWEIEYRGVQHVGSFDLMVRNVVPGTGMLMDAELARKYPSIPEAARFHDHWYPLVAAAAGQVPRPIHQPLYAYRIHGSNVVGVTPYRGLFNTASAEEGILKKCRSVWRRSHEMAQAAAQAGLPLGPWGRIAFLGKWDFGLTLFFRGLACLYSDPALARACFARAIGKLQNFGWVDNH